MFPFVGLKLHKSHGKHAEGARCFPKVSTLFSCAVHSGSWPAGSDVTMKRRQTELRFGVISWTVPDNPAESSSGVTKHRSFSRSWTPTSFRLCERGKSSPWQPRHECIKQLSLSKTMKHIIQMNNINNSNYLWWVWLKVGETFCSRSSLPADEDGDVFQKSSSCVLVCLNTSQRRRSQAKAKIVNPEFFSHEKSKKSCFRRQSNQKSRLRSHSLSDAPRLSSCSCTV